MDLDTRPPEMQRSTMYLWIQECPHCGYISGEISDETSITPEYLQSEEYLSCNGKDIKSDLAKQFYKYYMINMRDNNLKDAFYASLHAAWASDDKEDVEMANICRSQCIDLISQIIDNAENQTLIVMKADLMRRMGRFEDVILEYSDMKLEEELLQKIVKFQVSKAMEKDPAVYRVEDVVPVD